MNEPSLCHIYEAKYTSIYTSPPSKICHNSNYLLNIGGIQKSISVLVLFLYTQWICVCPRYNMKYLDILASLFSSVLCLVAYCCRNPFPYKHTSCVIKGWTILAPKISFIISDKKIPKFYMCPNNLHPFMSKAVCLFWKRFLQQ